MFFAYQCLHITSYLHIHVISGGAPVCVQFGLLVVIVAFLEITSQLGVSVLCKIGYQQGMRHNNLPIIVYSQPLRRSSEEVYVLHLDPERKFLIAV